jgi:hypothetical protein
MVFPAFFDEEEGVSPPKKSFLTHLILIVSKKGEKGLAPPP